MLYVYLTSTTRRSHATCRPLTHSQISDRESSEQHTHSPIPPSGKPIFISEGFERNPLQFANFALYGLPSLFLNPLLTANRSWKKTLLTYGAPGLVLGASIWDGLVSSMRVYTEEELRVALRGE